MSNQYRNSYWERTSLLQAADVAIIGGGFTGLQTAIGIKEARPEADVLLLERAPFSQGASTRNAGFACFGSPTELLEDLENGDSTTVWDTVARRYSGVRKLAKTHGRACEYRQHGGYELFYEDSATYQRVATVLPELNKAFAAVTGAGPAWEIVERAAGISASCRLVYCALEGQLHPGKLVEHLMRRANELGVRSLYGLTVVSLEGVDGDFSLSFAEQTAILGARKVVVATNAFSRKLLPELTIQPARNQVMITKPISDLKLRGCFHHERGYVYFRNLGRDRLLIGGARHLAGELSETTEFGANDQILEELTNYLESAMPAEVRTEIEIEQSWSGIIAQGGKNPIVRRTENGVIVAARLSGMGVALSAQVAEEAVLLALS